MDLQAIGWTPALAFYVSELAEPGGIPARVGRVDRGRLVLLTDGGELVGTWRAPLSVVGEGDAEAPTIGDWCVAVPHGETHRVAALLPRGTVLARAIASGQRASQLLAANVDIAFIVTGLDGDYSVRRIERYIAMCRAGGVRPVVILNKADLCDAVVDRRSEVERLAPGIAVMTLSALDSESSVALRRELPNGKTAVFLGSSGAGKSTLINGLLGTAHQRTAAVREDDSRGRHTTTSRELFLLDAGGAVIDTPGVRAVGLLVDQESLDATFEEIGALAPGCHFKDCRHESEPNCAVQAAVAAGELGADRLDSYLRLRREAESAALRQDTHAAREQERHTVGKYRKLLKEANRFKGR